MRAWDWIGIVAIVTMPWLSAGQEVGGLGEEVRFSITGGAHEEQFEIVDGDQLKLKSGVRVDSQETPELEVEITADNGVSKKSRLLTIQVTQLPEVLALSLDKTEIPENVEGATVGSLSAIAEKGGERIRLKTAGSEEKGEEEAEVAELPAEGEIEFGRHIQPILNARCVECHGPENQKGDLRLDKREEVIGGVVKPGNPDESKLFELISLPADDIDIMPSEGDPLSEQQIALIRQWIEEGADWPEETAESDRQIDFAEQIRPIFEESCFECHGSERQKGDLRLDQADVALGTIVPGNPEESELYKRITLPPDHDDVMPAEGDPLSDEAVALIREWIEEGAHFPVAQAETLDFEEEIRPILAKLSERDIEKVYQWVEEGALWPEEAYRALARKAAPVELVDVEMTEEEEQAIQQLQEADIAVMNVAQDSDWLRANFSLVNREITDDDLEPLARMPHLTELDLSGTAITDEGLTYVQDLPNLMRLDLSQTEITDNGVAHLGRLRNLIYLNLYDTGVTDAALEHLEGLKTLQRLYVWQTEVTEEGAEALRQKLTGVRINRGLELAEQQSESEEAGSSDGVSISTVLLRTFPGE